MDIGSLRMEYSLQALNESDVDADPVRQFDTWWNQAVQSNLPEVNAMTLATADKSGKPSARIVLLKGYSDKGFVFFTNYRSHKAKDLDVNPHAALVFFWKELERQVRIEGIVSKISPGESAGYFASRPVSSQLGAWASDQSEVISSRSELENKMHSLEQTYLNKDIPCPPYWGGYILKADCIEFWQGRPGRLHDRIQYTRQNEKWRIDRLAP